MWPVSENNLQKIQPFLSALLSSQIGTLLVAFLLFLVAAFLELVFENFYFYLLFQEVVVVQL